MRQIDLNAKTLHLRAKFILKLELVKISQSFLFLNVDFLLPGSLSQELEDAVQRQPPALTELITAFSREQEEKIYVQHRLAEKSAEVKQMVADGGYIFVCGATNMGKQVWRR